MAHSSPTPPSSSVLPIAVIGGGITGLAAAWKLTQLGHRVRLFEASPRLGGVIRSERTPEGWLIESGPNSFQENSRETADLLTQLGLASEILPTSPAAKKRFLVRRSRLHAAPMSPPGLLTTPIFTPLGKLRLLRDLFTRSFDRETDLSLATVIREHFGREFLDYAFNPFVSGVYAGDPEKLSARYSFPSLWVAEQTHGSLIRGLIAQSRDRRRRGHPKTRLLSFRDGLQTLPDTLARSLPPGSTSLSTRVETLTPPFALGAPWRVTFRHILPASVSEFPSTSVASSSDLVTENFSAVILALPAHSLAKLVFTTNDHRALTDRPLASLAEVVHPPVSSLFLGFRREQIAHPLDGFGALVPALEKRKLLGALFSSSLFPNRAPEGHVALTALAGGTRQPEIARLSTDRLLAEILPDLRQLLGITGDPIFLRHNFWPQAIPQYDLGHERFLAAMETCEHTYARLYIGGQTRNGISVPACLEAGLALADRAIR
ncbi:protoporphyrinogen oxidase [Nibricoccus aquaticus]|uniref:Coproporphyrinogen III oxidase n=1 Tax=Nibricoccus aquaticus TaxID=2576891 RepID=A0A290QLW0_9BACT|nr:protoporphyrinogen oxidase [Nibricoccus aquaticus]ATC65062.1 protoporphyrinogen oxidase [Nibricoccus aquaticus]